MQHPSSLPPPIKQKKVCALCFGKLKLIVRTQELFCQNCGTSFRSTYLKDLIESIQPVEPLAPLKIVRRPE